MKTISLTQGQVTAVDDEDFERVSGYKWHAQWYKSSTFYARTTIKVGASRLKIYMHRTLLLAKIGEQVDHINHDTLDNRRENIRIVTARTNQRNKRLSKYNTSGFCGVRWYAPTHKWVASVEIDGKTKHLGYFFEKENAILAREQANRKYGFHINHGKVVPEGKYTK